jgi:hypothetical protein
MFVEIIGNIIPELTEVVFKDIVDVRIQGGLFFAC